MLNRIQTIKFSVLTAALLSLGSAFAADNPADKSKAVKPSASTEAATPAAIKVSGGMLTDKNGMTLYTFDKDTAGSGKSACNGDCAAKWPPLFAADAAKDMGDFTVVARDDGRKQWAAKGKPLYLWTGDTKAGDANGDGVGGVWHKATR